VRVFGLAKNGDDEVFYWSAARWQDVPLPRGFELTDFADVGGAIWAVGLNHLCCNAQGTVAVYRLLHGRWRWMAMPRPRGFLASAVADGPRSVFVAVTRSGMHRA
jgi:hypothetical protein